ncbi:MAG: motility protein A [Desulfovibrionales bacterium]
MSVFLLSFLVSGEAAVYFNLTALMVVVSGTVGASLLSNGYARVAEAVHRAKSAYGPAPIQERVLIAQFLRLSLNLKKQGFLKDEDRKEFPYKPLMSGLELLEDNYEQEEIREILDNEMHFFALRREGLMRIFRNMAGFAPSFGVAGSVIGLIGLLVGLGETELILKNIPIALISTLYGVVLANFFLTPLAEKIQERTQAEIMLMQIVQEGVLALSRKDEFYKVQRRLNMLVAPQERIEDSRVVRKIKKSVFKTLAPTASAAQ